MTHICVSKLTIISTDNGLSPGRRQAIIWHSAGILLIGSLGTNFSEILIGIQTVSFKKMHLEISSAKCCPFYLGLNVLNEPQAITRTSIDWDLCRHMSSLSYNELISINTFFISFITDLNAYYWIEKSLFHHKLWHNIPMNIKDLCSITCAGSLHRIKRNHYNQWRHNGRDGVSNHQPHDCLLNRLFGRRSKKTSNLRVTGLCVGNSPGTGEFPTQMASNAENVSLWWRHHAKTYSSGVILINWQKIIYKLIWHGTASERHDSNNFMFIRVIWWLTNTCRPSDAHKRQ